MTRMGPTTQTGLMTLTYLTTQTAPRFDRARLPNWARLFGPVRSGRLGRWSHSGRPARSRRRACLCFRARSDCPARSGCRARSGHRASLDRPGCRVRPDRRSHPSHSGLNDTSFKKFNLNFFY